MDAPKSVVKVESKISDANIIHSIFSRCGEIQALYPYMTGAAGRAYFFIDFKDNGSSERALNLDNPDIHIQSLTIHPHLVDQYRTVNPLAFRAVPKTVNSKGSLSEHIPALTHLERDPDSVKRRKAHHGGTSRIRLALTKLRDNNASQSFCSPSGPSWLLPSLGTSATGDFSPKLHSSDSEPPLSKRKGDNQLGSSIAPRGELFLPTPTLSLTSPSTPALALPITFPASSLLSAASLPSPVSPDRALLDNGTFETRIVMTLCGESITFDLQTLDTDPKAIIELLKTTASERGNWMVVGAHYRRKGNVHAAITVVTTMIEVMTQHNVVESDLKPAFLMLSGCENDLKKKARAKGAHVSEVSEHSRKSLHWLQKVYGVNTPHQTSPQSTNALDRNVTSSNCPDQSIQPKCKDNNTLSIKPIAETTSSSAHSCSDVDIPSGPRQRLAPAPPKLISIANPSPDRYRILEREIQSLRDRQERQSTLLSESRSAKRNLEDDFTRERNLRRKLERQLGDVEQDLDTARKMETYALDQVKREVETRRRAEERAELERGMRMEMERVAERGTGKPLFEDLANMFQRAAQGEGVSFSGLGLQTGRSSHQTSPVLG